MATNIKLKRSATQGAVPGTSDIELGEIALNTYDGKMYMKKTVSGSSSIVELTGSSAPTSSAFAHSTYKYTASGSQTTFTGSDADSKTLSYTAGQIQVFLNGVLLDAADYTASNGSSVVLGSGASANDILYIISFEGTNPFDYFKYTATNAQTSFSGNDANSESLLYTVGNIAVYLNGVLLDATDYTATTGTSVVLASGASTGDILVIYEFNETGLTDVANDTTPQLGGDLDVNGSDIVSTSNANIDIIPHGTGNVNLGTDTVAIGTSGENVTITTTGTGDLTLNTNSGSSSGSILIADGANNDITITPNGTGDVIIDGLKYPQADGSADQVLKTDGSGQLSFTTISSAAITDADGDTKIQVEESSDEDTIRFDIAGTEQIVLADGVLKPTTDNDIDLGTSSLEFKDAFFDGTVTTDALTASATSTLADASFSGAVDANSTLNVSGHVSLDGSANELRFYEGSNYVGFEAPSLSADQIWVLPTADGSSGQMLSTNGSGTLSWATASSTVTGLTDTTISSIASGDYLIYNGSAWVNQAQASNAVISTMTGDNSDTTLSLSRAPLTENAVQVYWDGVYQHKDNWSLSGSTITFDTAPGTGVKVEAVVGSQTNILYGNDVAIDTMTGDGSDTTLALSVTPSNENHVNVYFDGVYQSKSNFSLSGSTITFSTAPPTGVVVEAVSNQAVSVGTATGIAASALTGLTEVTAADADHVLIYDASGSALKKALVSDFAKNTTEEIQDIIGGMVSSNTETGISVTYEDGDGTLDFALGAAQTTITSLLATDIKIGEDDQTKIDFETADEIHFYAANAHQVKLVDGGIVPVTDNDIDLGTSSLQFKDGYFDGTLETDALTINGSAFNYKTFGTSSLMIGDTTTGTIDAANYNTGVGVDVFAALTTGDHNVVLGYQAGTAVTTGIENTIVGARAGDALTTGQENAVFGQQALSADTAGNHSTAIGHGALFNQNFTSSTDSNNVAVGFSAMAANTTGIQNTAVGAYALDANTTNVRNTAVGYNALTAATNDDNTAVGAQALEANTTGYYNVAMGYLAGAAITTGNSNVAIGTLALDANTTASNNTAVGHAALTANTTGANNVAVGSLTLDANTTGLENTAVGQGSMSGTTTGSSNTAVGLSSLYSNTTASYNTAVGTSALFSNTEGHSNVAVGYEAGYYNTTGDENTALGYRAYSRGSTTSAATANNNTAIGAYTLYSNRTGASSVAVGHAALQENTTGNENTAVGATALDANTTGNNNAAFGRGSLTDNTTGLNNTGLGDNALANNTTASNNTAVGKDALLLNTGGGTNVALGAEALKSNTTASENVGVGVEAMEDNTTGASNVAMGYRALRANTTAAENTAVGQQAGVSNTTGAGNTYVGSFAGGNLTTGNNNVFIGHNTGTQGQSSSTNSSCVYIGEGASGNNGSSFEYVIGQGRIGLGGNSFAFGKASNVVYNLFASNNSWVRSSDLHKKTNIKETDLGLSFINELRPVTFNWRPNNELPKHYKDYSATENHMDTDINLYGMIAQDVEKALDKVGHKNFGGWVEEEDGSQSLSQEMFIYPLINAVKELSAKVEELESKLNGE